ncbi:YitT family protein [Thermoflavimicrobium dichotomicum]|uniref:Uncharacterized 5xTM membrane BCR, YitT family COG1284 n=1 Tax=Thermoflavimicrobium dichotomicum TaxID=46223 RepID=A0A1I3T8G8_9BACL|nr:YitT family protein [Thermoflavimicrobium dichotomicum]SFJ67364.1 Uncharacterised 5xTM membrane BCR, YitT family COG1284 [Thermoflavimicrobium dichotomicum]
MLDKGEYKRIFMILFGLFLEAFTYYHINYQNSLAEGGFVGLALLVKYVFGTSPALTMFILDFPLFIIGFKERGAKFLIYSVFAATMFSIFYDLCERFSPLRWDFSEMMLLGSILSGILTGFASGLVLRYGAAAGGEEILALYIHKHFGLEVGTFFIISDFIVLALSLWFLPLSKVMYTIIAITISGKMITWTYHSGERTWTPAKLAQ